MSSTVVSDGILIALGELLVATRLEICLFLVAVGAYIVLFQNVMPKSKGASWRKKRLFDDEVFEQQSTKPLSAKERERVESLFRTAFDSNDYRGALCIWSSLKRSQGVTEASIAQAVECMQRLRKDSQYIVREVKAALKKYGAELNISCVNDLLESLGKRADYDVMDKLVALLPSMGLKSDERTYEIILSLNFSHRRFEEVNNIVKEMKAQNIPLTARATVVAIKTAFKLNDFQEARRWFGELLGTWSPDTPSTAPQHIVLQLAEMACKEHQLEQVMPEFEHDEVPISEEVINIMLVECGWQKDVDLAQRVERLAVTKGVMFTERVYANLLKAFCEDRVEGCRVVDAVHQRIGHISPDLAFAVIAFCSQHCDLVRANALRGTMGKLQPTVFAAFIRFYIQHQQLGMACDLYEAMLKDESVPRGQPVGYIDPRLERMLMNAALRCGRTELASSLLAASPADIPKHILTIRNCAASGNLSAAVEVFNSLQKSGVELNSIIYNTVIDACVECRDLQAAEAWLRQTKDAGFVDVVSYNTLVKAYLATGNFVKAKGLMEEMRKAGFAPNQVTFNELINAVVTKESRLREGPRRGRSEVWALLEQMGELGIKPNQVTCSILMKTLNKDSAEADVVKVMDLIATMDEQMDEVLLSSVVEACVRIGKPDLVASKLKQLQGNDTNIVNGAHTFGSLIKAYGFSRDMDGAWRCWKEMRSRQILPTSVTLGCMVEAVVNNGDTEGAYELIHEISSDVRSKDVINSVIYCSILKGFAREKQLNRAWAVYDEMVSKKISLSIVVFNTLADACARCNRMHRFADIFEGMKKFNIQPNLITYSTIVKGHCKAGDIQTAFAVVKAMKEETGLQPDEIMYNSLMDGCAQSNLVEEGLRLLDEMQSSGITPSNFTLSVLVKLMSRARRLDAAFEVVEQISHKYRLSLNVHVYTNLAQACINNRCLNKAMDILKKMISEKVKPESRMYAILMRASLQQGLGLQAAELLRGALGLRGRPQYLESQVALCPMLDPSLVNEVLVSLADDKDLVMTLLVDIRHNCPRIRIELDTQRRIMMQR